VPPPLKRDAVIALVRSQIADGTLKPGAFAPYATALAAQTGYGVNTCASALAALVADGTLTRGPRGDNRPRVAPETGAGGTDPRVAGAALSARLRALRKARKLDQPALAELLGVSRTTIGHAETGRTWQRRDFWEAAEAELGGDLLALYDAYLIAEASQPAAYVPVPVPADVPPVPPVLAVSVAVSPECVTVTWSDGTVHVVRPPGRWNARGAAHPPDLH
jgi:DNA-binding transcriptional MocR family regulator